MSKRSKRNRRKNANNNLHLNLSESESEWKLVENESQCGTGFGGWTTFTFFLTSALNRVLSNKSCYFKIWPSNPWNELQLHSLIHLFLIQQNGEKREKEKSENSNFKTCVILFTTHFHFHSFIMNGFFPSLSLILSILSLSLSYFPFLPVSSPFNKSFISNAIISCLRKDEWFLHLIVTKTESINILSVCCYLYR